MWRAGGPLAKGADTSGCGLVSLSWLSGFMSDFVTLSVISRSEGLIEIHHMWLQREGKLALGL